jgi:ADP-ribose pyrophosphatase
VTKKEYKILKQESCYNGFFNMSKYQLQHTLYQGGWSEPMSRELFHRGNCVGVILYDARRDEVVIIEQFRIGAMQLPMEQCWLLEIVAGAVEEGEKPEEVAIREAVEEAGCHIEELIKINDFFTSPGGTSELLSLYCGKVDTSHVGGIHGLAHEHEDIKVSTLKFDDVYELLQQNKIISAIPIIAIQWLYIHHDELKQKWA